MSGTIRRITNIDNNPVIEEWTSAGETSKTFTIPAAKKDSMEMYRGMVSMKHDGSGAYHINCFVNGDETESNYITEWMGGYNGANTEGPGEDRFPGIIYSNGNGLDSILELSVMVTPSGRFMYRGNITRMSDSTSAVVSSIAGFKHSGTITSIDTLKFVKKGGGAIPAGTKIRLSRGI